MSTIKHVEDWDLAKRRWSAWWEREIIDRPVICITAPREGSPPRDDLRMELRKSDPRKFWTDVDGMTARAKERFAGTWFGGEAFPIWGHGWSVGHALTFGCEPVFDTWSVWVKPVEGLRIADCGMRITDEAIGPCGSRAIRNPHSAIPNWRDNPWWSYMKEATRQAARAAGGDYIVQMMWGNHAGDTLAMIRHSDQLMIDLAEDPDSVRRAAQFLSDALWEQWSELNAIIHGEGANLDGSVDYCGCWSPTPSLGFDTDISCMISPRQFREVFLPPLVQTMRKVDHAIYHFDGAVALHHLETVLDLPEVDAVQWLPGAGREEVLQWVPVIRRIQERGKSVVLIIRPEEVLPLLGEVKPEGLCMMVNCESQKLGRELLAQLHISKRP